MTAEHTTEITQSYYLTFISYSSLETNLVTFRCCFSEIRRSYLGTQLIRITCK